MAVGTITRIGPDFHGKQQPTPIGSYLMISATTVVGPTSYTTGGDALTAANLGLNTVLHAICTVTGSASNNTADVASYDIANAKLQFWTTTTTALAEAASTANLSGLTATITAFGY